MGSSASLHLALELLMEFTATCILPPLYCRLITESSEGLASIPRPSPMREGLGTRLGKALQTVFIKTITYYILALFFLCMHSLFLKKFPNNVAVPTDVHVHVQN